MEKPILLQTLRNYGGMSPDVNKLLFYLTSKIRGKVTGQSKHI